MGNSEAQSAVSPNNLVVEKFAIRAALGNNGGEWATHYNEDQKNHWRKFVQDLIDDISLIRP